MRGRGRARARGHGAASGVVETSAGRPPHPRKRCKQSPADGEDVRTPTRGRRGAGGGSGPMDPQPARDALSGARCQVLAHQRRHRRLDPCHHAGLLQPLADALAGGAEMSAVVGHLHRRPIGTRRLSRAPWGKRRPVGIRTVGIEGDEGGRRMSGTAGTCADPMGDAFVGRHSHGLWQDASADVREGGPSSSIGIRRLRLRAWDGDEPRERLGLSRVL